MRLRLISFFILCFHSSLYANDTTTEKSELSTSALFITLGVIWGLIIVSNLSYQGMRNYALTKHSPKTSKFLGVVFGICTFLLMAIAIIVSNYILLACSIAVSLILYFKFKGVEPTKEELKPSVIQPDISEILPKQKKKKSRRKTYIEPLSFSKLKNLKEIAFEYVDAAGNSSYRIVDISSVDFEYIKGYCHMAGDYRTFRIDRIQGEVICRETGEIIR